jgi:hypothetical protein
MEQPTHRLIDLFRQLGLAQTPAEVESFLASHRPLPSSTALADAPFWTPSQSCFLREGLADNADWTQVMDTLDASLREFRPEETRG